MHAMQKSLTLAGILALAITFGACGDGGDGGGCAANPSGPGCVPSPTPPPPPPPPFVIYGDSGSVPADSAVAIDFSIPNAGTVEATVDWTFPSSEVWIVMTTNACNDFVQAFLGSCSQIGAANRGTAKPKTVTGSVTQATSARLWIANFATVDESMAVQITLARSSSASAPVVLESFARSWVPVPNAAVRAVRLQD
jgi:hypothetical protein